MNLISNIWQQPKTSITGVLIATISIAGVLSQQGIALGTVGRGTVVALVGSLATALLGLLARDPEFAANSNVVAGASACDHATAKMGAWALIALLLSAPFTVGCSGTTVAQDIVNWTPTLQSAVATVDSTASLLTPQDAPIFSAATVGFDVASNVLVAQAKAYLANPTDGVLAQLQIAVVTFQQQVNAALLSSAKITNPNSQAHVLNAINAVGTVVTAILALVSSVSSKAAVAHMAAQSAIKISMVRPEMNEGNTIEMVASHYDEPIDVARAQVVTLELQTEKAGF